MNNQHRKPAWWILYLLLFVMVGALVLEGRDGLPSWAHEVADISIVILFFGSVAVWLDANGPALWDEEMRETKPQDTHIETCTAAQPWPPEENVSDEPNHFVPFQAYRFH